MTEQRQALERQHIPALALEYPLGNPTKAYRYVQSELSREARRTSRVFLVGWSVGGTMALRLGESGIPAGVAAVSPIADLSHWRVPAADWLVRAMLDPATRTRLDPSAHSCAHASPTLVVHSVNDSIAPYRASVRYARRCHAAFIGLREGHNIVNAGWLRWIERRARAGTRPR